MSRPYELTLADAAAAVAGRELSPVELVESVLARIEEVDPRLNAFVTVLADQARAAAKDAERALATGAAVGPLHGVPVTVKDLYDVAGVRTTASSRVREDAPPAARDSTVVAKLRDAGAIVVGKTHTHEFAYGMYTPTTRNPWRLDRSPGGSSGGAGASVAARMGMAGMGSDTGGSVRIPAALCGLTGLKPTYGRVSRHGVVPLSWSLDHAGPLTRTVRDAALIMNAIAGYDPADPAGADVPVPDFTEGLGRGVAGMTLGVPANHYFDGVDPEIAAAVRRAIDELASAGARLREVALPLVEHAVPAEGVILASEATAYHRRDVRERPHRYTEVVLGRLRAGERISGADYVTAQRLRAALRDAWRDVFDGIDALVAPTLGGPAALFGQNEVHYSDGREPTSTSAAYAPQCYPTNMTGLPSLTVPCGLTGDAMPIGLQIIARPFAEPTALRIGATYEAATNWSNHAPDL